MSVLVFLGVVVGDDAGAVGVVISVVRFVCFDRAVEVGHVAVRSTEEVMVEVSRRWEFYAREVALLF